VSDARKLDAAEHALRRATVGVELTGDELLSDIKSRWTRYDILRQLVSAGAIKKSGRAGGTRFSLGDPAIRAELLRNRKMLSALLFDDADADDYDGPHGSADGPASAPLPSKAEEPDVGPIVEHLRAVVGALERVSASLAGLEERIAGMQDVQGELMRRLGVEVKHGAA
jgi:hypothetical protein